MIAFVRVLFCSIWSILWITLSLVVYLFTLNSKIPVAMARTIWAPGILGICQVRIKVSGLENVDTEKFYVFVCNHQSYLDIPLLFKAININIYFVGKKELKIIPFLGWYMMATGMIFIDRTNRQRSIESLQRAAKLIHNGKSVIMFPEGTRNSDNTLGMFKKGSFMLARQAEVDVIPVGIRSADKEFSFYKFGRTTMEINLDASIPSTTGQVSSLIEKSRVRVGALSGKPVESLI